MRDRRPRLDPSLYIGLRRYYLTFCTADRRPRFSDADVVDLALQQFRQCATLCCMAIVAYCFMPDHVHLLVEGCTDGADALAFVHQAKQRSGFAFARRQSGRMWQPSFYDCVLRDGVATVSVARYIFENPVRGGMVTEPADYHFSGSSRFTVEQMLEAVYWQPGDSRNHRWQP